MSAVLFVVLYLFVELFWYELIEYVIVKTWQQQKVRKMFQGATKMASQMNVATDNVTLQCFYVKTRQIFG